MFADSHIHLSHRMFDGEVPCITEWKNSNGISRMNREKLIRSLQQNGIAFVVEPGIELESNEKILALAEAYPDFVYPAVGVHPTRAPFTGWKLRKKLRDISKTESLVAIGELGLDYHYKRWKQHRWKQKRWFVWQIKLAEERKLPLILHIREADRDAISLLRRHRKRLQGGVCHCFHKGLNEAKIYTEEFGFYLGIGGYLLQKENAELCRVIREIPLEYLLLETDGPYVKPEKPDAVTGKQWQKARNTSHTIPDIAEKIAEIKGIEIAEVERATTENARRLFGR